MSGRREGASDQQSRMRARRLEFISMAGSTTITGRKGWSHHENWSRDENWSRRENPTTKNEPLLTILIIINIASPKRRLPRHNLTRNDGQTVNVSRLCPQRSMFTTS
uniref:Uncharacterized protein n=1 Tax=Panagrellus redivivus TaxID=6233 RepID=A0A7E4W5X6_PANRE